MNLEQVIETFERDLKERMDDTARRTIEGIVEFLKRIKEIPTDDVVGFVLEFAMKRDLNASNFLPLLACTLAFGIDEHDEKVQYQRQAQEHFVSAGKQEQAAAYLISAVVLGAAAARFLDRRTADN